MRINNEDTAFDNMVIKQIVEIRKDLPKIGVRKLHKQLNDFFTNVSIGRDYLFKLLKSKNMMVNKAVRKKKFNYREDKVHEFAKYAMNKIDIRESGQVIASDITYLPKGSNGHFYLHLCVDLFSRTIVGWKLSTTLETKYSIKALKMGVRTLKSNNVYEDGWIHHSDRGCQYNSYKYCDEVEKLKGYRSMTIGGAPYQNAIVERINGILKQELLLRILPGNYNLALKHVKKCINTYNNKRTHWSLNLETPMNKLRA